MSLEEKNEISEKSSLNENKTPQQKAAEFRKERRAKPKTTQEITYPPLYILPPDRQKNAKVTVMGGAKGGTGKTTLGQNFAASMSMLGKNVLCIDADPSNNMSQRFGAKDDEKTEQRLNKLLLKAPLLNQMDTARNMPFVIDIEGLRVSPNAIGVKKCGILSLLAGSKFAADVAGIANRELTSSNLNLGYRTVFQYMEQLIAFWKQYYDYIVIDMAPSQDQSVLHNLMIKLTDEIICPIDDLSSAQGVPALLSLIRENTSESSKVPNVIFAMVRYSPQYIPAIDQNPDVINNTKTNQISNRVYDLMSNTFPSHVCTSGVKETKTMRKTNINFRKNPYRELSEEIALKIADEQRENILKYATPEKLQEFVHQLNIMEKNQLSKRATFKQPVYLQYTEADAKTRSMASTPASIIQTKAPAKAEELKYIKQYIIDKNIRELSNKDVQTIIEQKFIGLYPDKIVQQVHATRILADLVKERYFVVRETGTKTKPTYLRTDKSITPN